jgi:GTPase
MATATAGAFTGVPRRRPDERGIPLLRNPARELDLECPSVARAGWTHEELVAGVLAGDRRALARAITLAEDGAPEAEALVRDVYPRTGRAASVGVTGPPGVGKSTLVGALVAEVRGKGRTVGVVSVDPSSPFSRGALLGDRIRLSEHFLDPDVYIRSMGTRGHLGGLAEATLQALLLVDASGKDVVFLETVGTGQSEVEVIGIADVVLLVLMPGSGDAVQALKAGIMEIPDVIVVNKMDHPGAQTMLQEVRSIVALDPDRERRPCILLTDALRGEGVPELWEALEARRAVLDERGELAQRRERNLSGEVETLAVARLRERVRRTMAGNMDVREAVESVMRREVDPLTAVSLVVESVTGVDG